MIREQVISQWTELKNKFNQLSLWNKVFPNKNANQVQEQISILRGRLVEAQNKLTKWNPELKRLLNNVNDIDMSAISNPTVASAFLKEIKASREKLIALGVLNRFLHQ